MRICQNHTKQKPIYLIGSGKIVIPNKGLHEFKIKIKNKKKKLTNHNKKNFFFLKIRRKQAHKFSRSFSVIIGKPVGKVFQILFEVLLNCRKESQHFF